jgi:cytochrome P450
VPVVVATIDLGDAELWQDPYPVWRSARAAGRLARTIRGEPVLLFADDVDEVHADPAFGQLGLDALDRLGMHDGPFYEWRSRTMAAHDGPVHERLRGTVGRAFTPRRVEPMRARLRVHAESLLDGALERGSFDVVADYARDLPLWLICEFLGLPQGSRDEIGAFLAGTEEGFAEPLTADRRARAEHSIESLSSFVEGLVAAREAAPQEDLVTDLLDAEREGRLSRDEVVALAVNVIGGAVGSSRAGIANSILLLVQHPDQAAWVREEPAARVRGAVEECLRYHPPFRSGRRKALVPVERFGLTFQPGDTLFVARQSANRDPSRWTDPDAFDVRRPEQRHYSFGYGPHFCLGQALARLDIQESVAAFLDRMPGARRVGGPPRRVPFTADEQLESLPISF